MGLLTLFTASCHLRKEKGFMQNRQNDNGLIKVDQEFSFSIPGLFQTWNSNKPGFEKLNFRSEPGFEKT